jgi:cysteine-rich repeat protein
MATSANRCLVNGFGCTLLSMVTALGGCGGDTASTESATDAASTSAGPSTGAGSTSDVTTSSAGETDQPTTAGSNSASEGDTTTTTNGTTTTNPGTSTSTDAGTTNPIDTTTASTSTAGTTAGPGCGDGAVDEGEECDNGAENGPGKACNAECKTNVCGDSDIGPGEQCDDGNDDDADACVDCQLAFCGDGILGPGEVCDDGNGVDDDDCTNTCVVGLPGSCRPSEIHGASGGFPKFTDPAYANFLDKKVAVDDDQRAGGRLGPAHHRHLRPGRRRRTSTTTRPSTTTRRGAANLGKVFGLTLDSAGNIYVAPTTVYGANPTPATIKKIDSKTGAISDFATLPNNGPAFGNLNYDCVSETIYVSNHEDGRIYQLDMAGRSSAPTATPTRRDDGPRQRPRRAQRPVHRARPARVGRPVARRPPLLQRLERGHRPPDPVASNEIWSVGYVDEGGVPDPPTAKLEFAARVQQARTTRTRSPTSASPPPAGC